MRTLPGGTAWLCWEKPKSIHHRGSQDILETPRSFLSEQWRYSLSHITILFLFQWQNREFTLNPTLDVLFSIFKIYQAKLSRAEQGTWNVKPRLFSTWSQDLVRKKNVLCIVGNGYLTKEVWCVFLEASDWKLSRLVLRSSQGAFQ